MQQFQYIAAVFIFAGIASAVVIAADLRRCPQRMRIMRYVWILTGLWATLIGLKAYFAFGRPKGCSEGRFAQKANRHIPGAEAPEADGLQTDDLKRYGPGTDGKGEEAKRIETDAAAGTQPTMHEMETMSGMQTICGVENLRNTAAEESMRGMHAMQAMSGMESMREAGATEDMRITKDMPEMRNMEGMEEMQGMKGMRGMQMAGGMEVRPRWQSVVLSTLHCGAGCTLADLVGEWFLFFVPVSVAGSLIAGTWIIDYLLALLFGIGFQYAAIRQMEPRASTKNILRRAAKADILSLTAWQAGMYGWMAIVIFVINGGAPLSRTTFGFWFMMQIAMVFGFALSLPVNAYLIRKGIKHGM